MKLLANPIVLVALGLLLGVGTSIGVVWTASKPIVASVAAARQKKTVAEKPEAPWDFWTVEIEGLASELKDQKAMLRQREEALTVREARLAADQKELAKTRQQVETLRDELAGRMLEVRADEAKNLKTVANTFRNLSPKAAVPILSEMDPLTVVKVLAVMKADEVSAIFEEMGKSTDELVVKRAAFLTERMRLLKTVAATTP
jgi:flagellar motility protein MotE (MotC chaperone)